MCRIILAKVPLRYIKCMRVEISARAGDDQVELLLCENHGIISSILYNRWRDNAQGLSGGNGCGGRRGRGLRESGIIERNSALDNSIN